MTNNNSGIHVEAGGIEAIPSAKRHGSPWQLMATWSAPNLEFATIFIGVIGVAFFGLSFWHAVLAVTIGNALGAISHGVLSSWGPREGLVQFVLSRTAFGYRGNAVPAMLNTFMATMGWFAVNSVTGALALATLTGLDGTIALLIIVAAEIGLAFVGYHLVQAYEKWAAIALAVIFAGAAVVIFQNVEPAALADPREGFNWIGFTLTAGAAYGYASGWNTFAADMSRYLPKSVSPVKVGLAAGLGNFLSTTVLMIVGAAVALLPGFDAGDPTGSFVAPMDSWFASLVLLGIAAGAVAANALNLYSGAMSFLAAGIKLPFAWRRGIVVVVAGVFGTALAMYAIINRDFYQSYDYFLLVVAYWVAPWLGVVIMDRFLRRGTAITDFVTETPKYRNAAGLIAWLSGMFVSIGLFANQVIYTGWVAKNYPIGDITPVVGIVLGAVLYAVLFAVIRPGVSAKRP